MIAISSFRVIALGEFIPYKWLTDPINEELSKTSIKENDIEGESNNLLSEIGSMLVVLMVLIVVATITSVLVLVCKNNRKIQNIFLKLKKKIFWNSLIRYIQELIPWGPGE